MGVAGARVMLEQLDRVLAHEPGGRTGEDPEDVHRMRVAILGRVRDLDVFAAALRRLALEGLNRVLPPQEWAELRRPGTLERAFGRPDAGGAGVGVGDGGYAEGYQDGGLGGEDF
jgi:CHAD domain-containing protein